jgi:hypothetical protein
MRKDASMNDINAYINKVGLGWVRRTVDQDHLPRRQSGQLFRLHQIADHPIVKFILTVPARLSGTSGID